MYISVLSFETNSVDIIFFKPPLNKSINHEMVEDLLKFRGYDPDKVQYMVTSEISVNVK